MPLGSAHLVVPTQSPPPDGTRERDRRAITNHLLTALDELVHRYRTLPGERPDIAPEALTAELAHHLAVARSALERHPATF